MHVLVTTVLPYGETSEDRLIAGGMKPVGKWVFKEILLSALLVRFQVTVEDWLEL